MSNIFDALKKTQGEVASLALPCIDNAGVAEISVDERQDIDPVRQAVYFPRTLRPDTKERQEIPLERLGRVIVHADPKSAAADRFRLLQMRLRELWTAGKLRSLLVTSPFPGDGKTTVALNLATALAEERERRVLLVDADLHRGNPEDQLGFSRHVGLMECLRDGLNPVSAVRRVEPLGWHLLSSGKTGIGSPTELLQPQQISWLVEKLSFEFDWIIFDCPPVLALSDAVSLTPYVDGSLLVARAGRTSAKAVEDAISLLGRKHLKGVILNAIEKLNQPYSAYYKYQGREKAESDDTV